MTDAPTAAQIRQRQGVFELELGNIDAAIAAFKQAQLHWREADDAEQFAEAFLAVRAEPRC